MIIPNRTLFQDLQRELKKIGLAHFVDGEVDSINPNLGIDEQAELLPYDKKWEFPIERLKLGKKEISKDHFQIFFIISSNL